MDCVYVGILSNIYILFYETALIAKESAVNVLPLGSTGGSPSDPTSLLHMRGHSTFQSVPPPL